MAALSHKMVKQIAKYGTKLFANPIEVDNPIAIVLIYPQRSNNILKLIFP